LSHAFPANANPNCGRNEAVQFAYELNGKRPS
jgi:hypothetical protein